MVNPQTTTKFLDQNGREIPKKRLLPDLSNVVSMVTSGYMNLNEIDKQFPGWRQYA